MIRIEIVAPPGAGKTTVAGSLEKELKNMGLEVFWAGRLSLFKKISFKTIVLGVLEFLSFLPFTKIFFLKKTFIKKTNLTWLYDILKINIKTEIIKSLKTDNQSILIGEPGHAMHFLACLFYSLYEPDETVLRQFAAWLSSRCEMIIFLNVSTNTALKRLEQRERGFPKRMRSMSSSDIKKAYQKTNETFLKLNNLFKEKNIPFFIIDVELKTSKQTAKEIALQIKDKLK